MFTGFRDYSATVRLQTAVASMTASDIVGTAAVLVTRQRDGDPAAVLPVLPPLCTRPHFTRLQSLGPPGYYEIEIVPRHMGLKGGGGGPGADATHDDSDPDAMPVIVDTTSSGSESAATSASASASGDDSKARTCQKSSFVSNLLSRTHANNVVISLHQLVKQVGIARDELDTARDDGPPSPAFARQHVEGGRIRLAVDAQFMCVPQIACQWNGYDIVCIPRPFKLSNTHAHAHEQLLLPSASDCSTSS